MDDVAFLVPLGGFVISNSPSDSIKRKIKIKGLVRVHKEIK